MSKRGSGQMLEFFIKSIISTTLVMGTGWALFSLTTPSPDQIRKEMELAGRISKVDLAYRNEMKKKQMEMIFANAKSDRPIWDVYGETDKKTTDNK
jgi:hypothetical protein